ncbi:CmcJ/NvfI family oxidoreductase [Vineibacter terrae]|uniref:CmcJ/NvfI family oxidoreductase n=1 Tax=Vineibacter terrae TaxID=2586908 RepID=UPI002E3750B8|nr:CmcJ/NvfI family oxidoreductase [Vineibacter terrae]HEX2892094.1 CmcJ/NvfI family oxidoreductase [Vineibacter terrae]
MDSTTQISLSEIGQINAPLNYLVRTGERPVSYQYEPPPGVPARSGHYSLYTVPVHDGRVLADSLSLDQQGFALRTHASAVSDFADDRIIRAAYYPEVERLVKDVTGAARVVMFDHNVRLGAADRPTGIREPVKRVHNDYTDKSGPQRVRDLMGDEAETLLRRRYVFINVWRPIREPVLSSPLAVCDAQSMDPADLIPSDLRYRDRTGETYAVAYNPRHRWFYFPRMRRNEVLFLKCFDSATDGRARLTAHTAFDDPTIPADAPPRESIEARTIAFF